jgi:hypothetical protein
MKAQDRHGHSVSKARREICDEVSTASHAVPLLDEMSALDFQLASVQLHHSCPFEPVSLIAAASSQEQWRIKSNYAENVCTVSKYCKGTARAVFKKIEPAGNRRRAHRILECGYAQLWESRWVLNESAMHAMVMLLHRLGWLAFWLVAVFVVLFVGGLALGLVAWMIDRLTDFGDKH